MTKPRGRPLFIEFAKPLPPGKPGEGGGPVTTMMVGEEKGRPDPGQVTTLMVNEERGRPDPGQVTTMMVGEEGDAR